jgi:hypothetical protein
MVVSVAVVSVAVVSVAVVSVAVVSVAVMNVAAGTVHPDPGVVPATAGRAHLRPPPRT